MRLTPDHLTYRNARDGSIVYGGPPPESPDNWERVYVFTEDGVHARDKATRAQVSRTTSHEHETDPQDPGLAHFTRDNIGQTVTITDRDGTAITGRLANLYWSPGQIAIANIEAAGALIRVELWTTLHLRIHDA